MAAVLGDISLPPIDPASIRPTFTLTGEHHEIHQIRNARNRTAAAAMTEGEVRKIDKAQGKIALKHGEIKNLDMPAMTMTFRAAGPKMLDNVKEGDKINFNADKIGGQFTVTGIEKK